jgi:hypothetical protein
LAIDAFYPNEEWAKLRRPSALKAAETRLANLATWLGDRDYLEARFTAGDLLMTTVLRILRRSDMLAAIPALDSYRQRCEAARHSRRRSPRRWRPSPRTRRRERKGLTANAGLAAPIKAIFLPAGGGWRASRPS